MKESDLKIGVSIRSVDACQTYEVVGIQVGYVWLKDTKGLCMTWSTDGVLKGFEIIPQRPPLKVGGRYARPDSPIEHVIRLVITPFGKTREYVITELRQELFDKAVIAVRDPDFFDGMYLVG